MRWDKLGIMDGVPSSSSFPSFFSSSTSSPSSSSWRWGVCGSGGPTRRSPAGGSSWRWPGASSWDPWSSATWYRWACLCAAPGWSTCRSGWTVRTHQTTSLPRGGWRVWRVWGAGWGREKRELGQRHHLGFLTPGLEVSGFKWWGERLQCFHCYLLFVCVCARVCVSLGSVQWHAATCWWTRSISRSLEESVSAMVGGWRGGGCYGKMLFCSQGDTDHIRIPHKADVGVQMKGQRAPTLSCVNVETDSRLSWIWVYLW